MSDVCLSRGTVEATTPRVVTRAHPHPLGLTRNSFGYPFLSLDSQIIGNFFNPSGKAPSFMMQRFSSLFPSFGTTTLFNRNSSTTNLSKSTENDALVVNNRSVDKNMSTLLNITEALKSKLPELYGDQGDHISIFGSMNNDRVQDYLNNTGEHVTAIDNLIRESSDGEKVILRVAIEHAAKGEENAKSSLINLNKALGQEIPFEKVVKFTEKFAEKFTPPTRDKNWTGVGLIPVGNARGDKRDDVYFKPLPADQKTFNHIGVFAIRLAVISHLDPDTYKKEGEKDIHRMEAARARMAEEAAKKDAIMDSILKDAKSAREGSADLTQTHGLYKIAERGNGYGYPE